MDVEMLLKYQLFWNAFCNLYKISYSFHVEYSWKKTSSDRISIIFCYLVSFPSIFWLLVYSNSFTVIWNESFSTSIVVTLALQWKCSDWSGENLPDSIWNGGKKVFLVCIHWLSLWSQTYQDFLLLWSSLKMINSHKSSSFKMWISWNVYKGLKYSSLYIITRIHSEQPKWEKN